MPGLKGVNCSSGKADLAAGPEEEKWKLYDNPFFAAAVASAVVEATLSSQELVKARGDKEKKQGERSLSRERPRNSGSPSGSTPKSAKLQRQPSPEVRKKQQQSPHPAEDPSERLRLELLKTWTSVERLEKAHTAAKSKLDRLASELEDGRSLWESQVQDKITSSLQALRHKLKEERDANKSLELANRKLEAELGEIRKAIAQAKKETAAERNSKRMIEDVCDELAREVGDDRAAVLELRQKSSAARREAEEARKALQMGEVWKEEKIQGRLGEARLEMEQRNGELDAAIAKMEGFLGDREKLLAHRVDETTTTTTQACGSSSGGSSPGSFRHSSERKVYKEQTRLLLNGSGFHMRNNNRSYMQNGGKTSAIPKVWPTSKTSNL